MMPVMFKASDVSELIRSGGSCRVPIEVEPAFSRGDGVVVLNINPASHTRLPRYVRGKAGKVIKDHGVFVFPDTNAHLRGEKPQHVYGVEFAARELWGEDASSLDKVYVDLFEDYLRKDGRDGSQ